MPWRTGLWTARPTPPPWRRCSTYTSFGCAASPGTRWGTCCVREGRMSSTTRSAAASSTTPAAHRGASATSGHGPGPGGRGPRPTSPRLSWGSHGSPRGRLRSPPRRPRAHPQLAATRTHRAGAEGRGLGAAQAAAGSRPTSSPGGWTPGDRPHHRRLRGPHLRCPPRLSPSRLPRASLGSTTSAPRHRGSTRTVLWAVPPRWATLWGTLRGPRLQGMVGGGRQGLHPDQPRAGVGRAGGVGQEAGALWARPHQEGGNPRWRRCLGEISPLPPCGTFATISTAGATGGTPPIRGLPRPGLPHGTTVASTVARTAGALLCRTCGEGHRGRGRRSSRWWTSARGN